MIKNFVIDATNYPVIIVRELLSAKGVLGDTTLGDGEEKICYTQYYDYQPEDLEGGDQWLKDRRERASCLRRLSLTGT